VVTSDVQGISSSKQPIQGSGEHSACHFDDQISMLDLFQL
jgi:hypothetical protein